MVKDPVCGMTVDPASAAASVEHEGVTYYFCSQGCRDRFAAEPAAICARTRASGDAGSFAACSAAPDHTGGERRPARRFAHLPGREGLVG